MNHDGLAHEPCKVLFLCTGNSARSTMAEAILNHLGRQHFQAFSAGSHPKEIVHPHALRLLDALGYETSGLRSKSWNEFTTGKSFDCIITVCNMAAGVVCPTFPGRPANLHWDIPDPTAVSGSQFQIEDAFRQTFDMLLGHITALIRQ